jgi:hypothetical protein
VRPCETCHHFDPLTLHDSKGEVTATLRYCSHKRLTSHEHDEGWPTPRAVRFSPPRGFGCVWHMGRNASPRAPQATQEARQ